MKVLYYRFFLNKTDSLFGGDSRDDIVKKVFENKFRFQGQNTSLAYFFHRRDGNYIYSSIAKQSKIIKVLSPEEGLKQETEENWPNCNLFINVGDDPINGQTIAFEFKSDVFRNQSTILKKLEDEINKKLLDEGFVISLHPINTEFDFWQVVKDNPNNIKELTFSFSSPNLFRTTKAMNEELKELNEQFNMTKTDVTLKNEEGLLTIPENDDFVNKSVDYVTGGGGEYRLVLKKGSVVTSQNSVKTKKIEFEELDLSVTDSDTFKTVLKSILND